MNPEIHDISCISFQSNGMKIIHFHEMILKHPIYLFERSELFEQRSCEDGELQAKPCSTTSELEEAKLPWKRPALLACDDFDRNLRMKASCWWAHRTKSKPAVRACCFL